MLPSVQPPRARGSLDISNPCPEGPRKLKLSCPFGPGRMTGANRSWCQKVGQMSQVFQVQTTGRFEVEFAKHIRNPGEQNALKLPRRNSCQPRPS
jgi:hypothetical protein